MIENPLTASEIEAFESVGFNLRDHDHPGRAVARTRADLEALAEGSLSVETAAALLGIGVGRVRRRLAEGSLYGFWFEGGQRLPCFQFDGRSSLPDLDRVLEALGTERHPLEVEAFFCSVDPDLELAEAEDPLSPRDWLREGLPAAVVIRLAAE